MDQRTIEIIKRFGESWDETEMYYDHLIARHSAFERLKPVREFIFTLKQNGYNQFFRLGTSIHRLIISRSVNNGLRRDQKFIQIEVLNEQFEIVLRDGDKVYREYMINSLSDHRVEKLLITLRNTLVD